jgi:hypothetical protein
MTILNRISTFNLTDLVNNKLYTISPQSLDKIGRMGIHVIGAIATSVTAIIDTIYHTILGAFTFVTGLVVTPYNFIAGAINNNYKAPYELELSASIIHLSLRILASLMSPIDHIARIIDSNQGYHMITFS